MNIGDKIKEQRLKKEWTQEQLGQLLNVSRPTISSWEVGRNYPDLEMVVAISDLFGISLDNLLRGDREMMKDYSKKLRWNKYYKIIFGVIVVLVIVVVGSIAKLNWEEYRYRNNLSVNGWQQADNLRNPDEFELRENGIDYFTSFLSSGFNPIPFKEHHPYVTAHKGNLVVNIRDKNERFIIIDPAGNESMKYRGRIAVDEQCNIIEETSSWSDKKKQAIRGYLSKYKLEYAELLEAASEKRTQIVQ